MTRACEDLHAFADGELSPAEAEAFREHLAGCADCARALSDILQFGALARAARDHAAAPAPAPAPRRKPGGRTRLVAIVATTSVLSAGLAAGVVLRWVRPPTPPVEIAQRPPNRAIRARVAVPELDRHAPHSAAMGERSTIDEDLVVGAQIQRSGDEHRLAAFHLVHRHFADAIAPLRRAGDSPDVLATRAALALGQDRPEEALDLTDRVLRERPNHPQALWNRALALTDLTLDLTAAAAFDAVAALKEPGWGAEAETRAAALRREVAQRREPWGKAQTAGLGLITQGSEIPLDLARRHPGVIRLYFYDALRAAPSRERVLQLLPLARALDETGGGDTLQRLVNEIAGADFRVRAPFAARYLQLYNDPARFDGKDWDGFLNALRRAKGQEDILLGAFVQLDGRGAKPGERGRLARERHDPWFDAMAPVFDAEEQQRRGELVAAADGLERALAACDEARVGYRCGAIRQRLAEVYAFYFVPARRRAVAQEGLERARRSGTWSWEGAFLNTLADTARYEHAFVLARAYLDELKLRHGDNCSTMESVGLEEATIALAENRIREAREAVGRVRSCEGAPEQLAVADTLAELRHWGPLSPEEEARARRVLDAAPVGVTSSAEIEQIRGRLLVEPDPAAARTHLLRSIEAANAAAVRSDAESLRARHFSYSALIMADGRKNDFDAALTWMAEEAGLTLATSCVVGAAVDYDRVLAVVRGADGKTQGRYVHHWEGAIRRDRIVPPELQATLHECRRVDVIARPPLQGWAELLSSDVAWAYRTTAADRTMPAPAVPPKRIVVSGIKSPPGLEHLGETPTWMPTEGDKDTISLRGTDATPSHVLQKIADATDIEFHAHGLIVRDRSNMALLVLSPDSKDNKASYALTDGDLVRPENALRGAPWVFLASCGAARTPETLHTAFGLPHAFLRAGARAVFASPKDVDDENATRFFDRVRAKLKDGADPAEALRDARQQWAREFPERRMDDVILFR